MRCFSAKLETVGVILSLASLLAAFGGASSADARPKEKKTKSSSVESQTLSEVENWLRAASQAELSAEFSATVDLQRDGAPLTRWRLWRNGNKERMEYVAPPVRKGDLLVDDGQNVWLYHRADNTAIQTKSRPRSLDFESLSARGLQTRLGDDQKIDEREARVLEVRRSNGRIVRRLFVDEKTRVLLGHQTFANGKSVERMTFGDLKTGEVADSRFRWNPPQGDRKSVV